MFVDRVTIFVRGGDGGQGCLSFRREKYVPRGGPNGGNGGKGGSVRLCATQGVDSFASLANRKHWHAERGAHGQGKSRHGRNGQDLTIEVPPGTIVRDRDQGHTIRDMNDTGDEVTVARGGKGGRGNKEFATSTNRAPREWEPGESGEERWIELELKVIADVGLIGKPNAGKSTLLSRISRAQPEIANYPFTTKYPNLGIVQSSYQHRFVVADIPGLIEGAHAGAGLGHEFLRHVERTRILVHLVEPSPTDNTEPIENYYAIRRELELHDPELSKRPEIITVTKSEIPVSDEIRLQLEAKTGQNVLGISAVTGQGLSTLVHQITDHLAQLQPNGPPEIHQIPPHLSHQSFQEPS